MHVFKSVLGQVALTAVLLTSLANPPPVYAVELGDAKRGLAYAEKTCRSAML